MGRAAEQERRLVQYLLGQLPPAEAQAIEEGLFADDELREELLATADDLIHSYLCDGLPPEGRVQFETHFLASPRHQERLAYIQDLLSALERVSTASVMQAPSTAPAARFRPAWALAAALALVIAGGLLWLTLRPSEREPRQAAATPLPSAASPFPSTTPPLVVPSPSSGPSPGAKHDRAPGDVRLVRLARQSEGPVSVAVDRRTRVVRVEVPVAEDHPSFDAVLRRRDGPEVWRAEGLLPPSLGKPLILDIPARVLVAAEYALLIEGERLRGPAAPPPLAIEYSLSVSRER